MPRVKKDGEIKMTEPKKRKPVSVIASREKEEMEVIPDNSIDIVDETKAGMKDIDTKKPIMEVYENPVIPIKTKKEKKIVKDTGDSLCLKDFNYHDGQAMHQFVAGVKYNLKELTEETVTFLVNNEVFAIK